MLNMNKEYLINKVYKILRSFLVNNTMPQENLNEQHV